MSQPVDDAQVRLTYATQLLQVGQFAEGLLALERLRADCEWSPVLEAYIGGALLGLERLSEAKDVLDAAYARAGDNFYVCLKRGELYCRFGIYPTAIEALRRALATSGGEAVGRQAARELLRFATDKQRGGFVRQLAGGGNGWPWRRRLTREQTMAGT